MAVLIELLKDAWVYVRLDPRRDGVALPEWLRTEPSLTLQYGYNMPIPIQDFVVDEKGIGATLSFQKRPYSTFIPWSAVFIITDGEKRGVLWEEDMPEEVRAAIQAAVEKEAGAPAKPSPPLAAAPAASEPAAPAAPAAAPAASSPPGKPGKRPRPSHLKLVD